MRDHKPFNFSEPAIAKLETPNTGRIEWRDSGGPASVKGLVLLLSSSGSRTYMYRYRLANDIHRRYKLGDARMLTVAGARERAKECRLAVENGEDPAMARAEKREEIRLSELIALYLGWTDDKAPASIRQDGYCLRLIEDHAPELLRTPLSAVRSDDIERLHKRVGRAYARERGRPFAANAVVKFLRGVFNLARSKNVYTGVQNPARTGKKRGNGIKLLPEPPRTRYLSDDEIDRVRAALEKEPEEWRAYFSLLLLLGLRRSELLTARWENVDLSAGTLRLPKTKTGARVQPLPRAAVEIFRTLSSQHYSPWCFPASDSKSGHRVEPSRAWKRVLERAGVVGPLPVHSIRHSAASVMIRNGVDLHTIGQVLGHARSATTTKLYAHIDHATQLAAMEQAAERAGFNTVAPEPTVTPSVAATAREVVESEDGAFDADETLKLLGF